MKLSFATLFIASSLSSALASAPAQADVSAANSDCHIYVDRLQLVHGCVFIQGPGLGPCPSWEDQGPVYEATLTRTSMNHYQINDPSMGLEASVVFNGRDQAQISIRAPQVNQTKIVGVTYENFDSAHQFPDSSSQASSYDLWRLRGLEYNVSCSFGLSDVVNAQQSAEQAEMDRLGPAREWSDASAPSLETLPRGTVLELTQDMDIQPGSETALTKFVEQNGLMTLAGFDALNLQFRFAYAEIFNANNGYINPTHYAKGTRMMVTGVKVNQLSGGHRSYELMLQSVGAVPADPIVRIEVTGRRAGGGDVKIPQLAALLAPTMTLELPSAK